MLFVPVMAATVLLCGECLLFQPQIVLLGCVAGDYQIVGEHEI